MNIINLLNIYQARWDYYPCKLRLLSQRFSKKAMKGRVDDIVAETPPGISCSDSTPIMLPPPGISCSDSTPIMKYHQVKSKMHSLNFDLKIFVNELS